MDTESDGATPETFFAGSPTGLRIFEAIRRLVEPLEGVSVRVSRSQIALRRRTGFAFVWRPGQYVRSDVPAVLSLAFRREVASERFKSVVHPSPRVWMHHLELRAVEDVDNQVRGWLQEAYAAAGDGGR